MKTMNLHITFFISSFLSFVSTFHITDLNIISKVKQCVVGILFIVHVSRSGLVPKAGRTSVRFRGSTVQVNHPSRMPRQLYIKTTPIFLHGSKIIFRCNCTKIVKDCVCKNFKIQISFKNEVIKECVVREQS